MMKAEADPNKASETIRIWTRTRWSLAELVAEKVRTEGRVVSRVELLDTLVSAERERIGMAAHNSK